MSRGQPGPACRDLSFREPCLLSETAEVALEDYARALLRGEQAEAIHDGQDPARVGGVHVCGLAAPPDPALLADLEAFARELAAAGGEGLGWT